jgi:hypothetical protein
MNGAVPRRSRKTEAIGILCIAAAVLLALCLYSYDPWDPSLNVEGRQTVARNYIGKAGAYTADLLLQTLGLASFLLVVPAILMGISSFSGVRDERRPVQSALGYMTMIVCIASALEMFRLSPPYEANFSGGGVLGRFMSDMLQEYFNFQGALIVLATLMALALLMATSVSLQGLARFIFLTPFLAIGASWKNWRARREARKRLRPDIKPSIPAPVEPIPMASVKAPHAAKPAPEATSRVMERALE